MSSATALERDVTDRRIAIIGTGFSGLCLAIHLKGIGIDSFTLYEKTDRVGGTWRDNTYPGAACDVPSFAYCFSFEQKTDWSRKWAGQEEILDYIDHCVQKYEILPHIEFGTEITHAKYDEKRSCWTLRNVEGEEVDAEILVSGVGQLNRPAIPNLPGLETFSGPQFHSAQWDHDTDLEGKLVGVVGNAASAVQFVPEIAARVERLRVFQRSANWMFEKGDREYSEKEKQRFARHPLYTKLYRSLIWARFELGFPLFRRNRVFQTLLRKASIGAMRRAVDDPALQELLVPDYPIGGKRMLISDDYYPTLNRENVELIASGIDHFSETGITTQDGVFHRLDVVILATGFDSTSFLAPMEIEGVGGRSLRDDWKHGAEAYLGLTVAGYPNFFMMYGPNTNLGHNSIIFMIECQSRYIIECIEKMNAARSRSMELRPGVMRAYNEQLSRDLERTAWAATEKSWYKNEEGKITNNWSGTTARYWWLARRANLRDYLLK